MKRGFLILFVYSVFDFLFLSTNLSAQQLMPAKPGEGTLNTCLATSSSPIIIGQEFPLTYASGGNLIVSITVDDVTKVNSVTFKSGGISESLVFLKSSTIVTSGNKFEKVISANDLKDPIGLTYYFEITDNSTIPKTITSTIGYSYLNFPAAASDQVLPYNSFGSSISNYQLISFPYTITSNNVSSVFGALVPYNKTKWRLFDFADGNNREYPDFSTILPGKGYWLIIKNNTIINPGDATVVKVTEDAPFVIDLVAGWNLIGNPYNFNILWSDVLAANTITAAAASVDRTLTTLTGNNLTNTATILPKFRGAFVKAASAVSLKIPVKYNEAAGRIGNTNLEWNSIDQTNWEITLKLNQDGLINEMCGFGMNKNGLLKGKDQFDLEQTPLPFSLTELVSYHSEVSSFFSRDIVPTQENFTWTFEVKQADASSSVTVTWANDNFGDNNKQLFLYDPATLSVVDMRKSASYKLSQKTNKIMVLFGDANYIEDWFENELPILSNPYPNPAINYVTIPFRIPKSFDNSNLEIKIYNAFGKELYTLVDSQLAKGNYETFWQPQMEQGIYFVRMQLADGSFKTQRIIIK